MGASRLRFSSEGPFVQNEEGGPSEPSTGFQLRRVAILADNAASITSGAATPLTTTPAELGALSLNLRYRAANFTGGPAGGEILVGFGGGVGVQVTVIEEL